MTPFVDLITTAFDQLSNIVLMSGIQILIFLAALQTISPSLFEASDMEGASKWEAFWKITFPMVSPMILVATMYTMIDVLTGSGNPMISYLFGTVGSTSLSLSDRMTMGWLYFICAALLIVIVSAIISRFVYNENDVTTKKGQEVIDNGNIPEKAEGSKAGKPGGRCRGGSVPCGKAARLGSRKGLLQIQKDPQLPVGHYQNRASCRTLLADPVSDAGAVLSIA
ncbi:MAG: ABC transporter permease subunit [Oscillospiraceae bacterium]|nr:MAG: ABC transporter permease subunit [Oscillospiraceae bacterium]